jgi:signal transduction histidine kinase
MRSKNYEAQVIALLDEQALVVLRDLSGQKLAEQRLPHLEHLITLGQLAASLAHEINNPLQVIQGYLDLILDFRVDDAERQRYLQVMRQQVQWLARLVADMLTFSRPQSPKSRLISLSEPAEVREVIQRVLTLAGKQLRQSGIRVTTEVAAGLCAQMPTDQLLQVCLNVVVNAIDALQGWHDGCLHIVTQEAKGILTLSFCNNGPAIPPSILPFVQEPFYTTKPSGSGLGLWICRNLLQEYGGALGLRNLSDDRGVVVEVTLPVAL